MSEDNGVIKTIIHFKGKFTIGQGGLPREKALIDTQREFVRALGNLPDYMEVTEWDDATEDTGDERS